MEASALKQEDDPEPEPGLHITVDDSRWTGVCDAETVCQRALGVVNEHVQLPKVGFAINVLFTDDPHVQALNKQFRQQDRPTNILSFPNYLPEELERFSGEILPELGDMALAYETCRREAIEQEKPFVHHATHLLIHGILHLLGYDHQEDAEANEMEALEVRLLAALSIPNPYEVNPHE